MFEFARWVVRNKAVSIGLVVTLFILFGGSNEPQHQANAWSAGTAPAEAKVAYGDQTTTGDRALHVISGAVKTVGADKLLPAGMRAKTIDNWSAAEKAVTASGTASGKASADAN